MVVPPVVNYFLISTLLETFKYVPQWLWKRLAMALSLQTLLKVQSNISGIFEPFSIRLRIKKMKTQETFKKKSALTGVPHVINYFLISTLLETFKYVPQWLWKRLAMVLSLQTLLKSAKQHFWHLWTIFYQIMPQKMKTQETFKKKSALTNGYEKGWPWFCQFKPYWKVQRNISGMFERFSIRLCPKNWRHRKPSRKSQPLRLFHLW